MVAFRIPLVQNILSHLNTKKSRPETADFVSTERWLHLVFPDFIKDFLCGGHGLATIFVARNSAQNASDEHEENIQPWVGMIVFPNLIAKPDGPKNADDHGVE